MRWDLPGKVLIIDNRFSTIKDSVSKLTKSGVPVLFWNGRGNPPRPTSGVRIVILDLDLTDSGEEFYDYTAKVLGKVPGPYVVLIYSINATPESPRRIEECYLEVNGRQVPGFILRVPVMKQEERDAEDIISMIKTSLDDYPILDAILLAEHNLELARDHSLSELAQKKFEPSFRTLIKAISKSTGPESVGREMMLSLARFQSRNITSSKSYVTLKNLLAKILTQGITGGSPQLHARIMHLRMYYRPDPDEIQWTGDIYRTQYKSDTRRFAILITPACDISSDKACYLTFCYGFSITERNLTGNLMHPIYSIDSKVTTEIQAHKYLGFKGIQARFYFLDNFVEASEEELSRVIFDFQALESIRLDEFKKRRWKRLWRLDSPYAEDFLQRFGAHSFRLGTPNRLEV